MQGGASFRSREQFRHRHFARPAIWRAARREYVEAFTFTRFEPSGRQGNDAIRTRPRFSIICSAARHFLSRPQRPAHLAGRSAYGARRGVVRTRRGLGEGARAPPPPPCLQGPRAVEGRQADAGAIGAERSSVRRRIAAGGFARGRDRAQGRTRRAHRAAPVQPRAAAKPSPRSAHKRG
jgi:hypothetical protein